MLKNILRATYSKLTEEEIEDIVQLTLVKVWMKAGSYRQDNDASAWAWIKKIASNLALDFLRSKKRCFTEPEEELERLPYLDKTTDDDDCPDIDWVAIRKKLTAREWQVLALWSEGVNSKTTAEMIGVSPARVSQLLKSALEKINKPS